MANVSRDTFANRHDFLELAGEEGFAAGYPGETTEHARIPIRIIRLEERLRLQTLLPEELRPRINELRTSQLIGLRFCCDEELAEVAGAVLAGEVKSQDEIKRRVRQWRADHHRI